MAGEGSSGSNGDEALIGHIVAGRYEILAHLGSGGMGSVFKARQIAMDRPVALKLLHAHYASNTQAVARFNREMQVTARVEHPNTIRVYDYGQTEDGRLFLAIEFLEGRTMTAALKSGEPMASERIVHIGVQIAKALAAAHHDGVVHRDLKPDNVMLVDRYGERDFVKVLDFGIARFTDDQSRTNLTTEGAVVGTPIYMSPEQATGGAIDVRTDIYSFGVMLFQMATGRVPFDAPTTISLMVKHVHEEPPRPSDFAPGLVPEPLETLILQMLAKNPAARPRSANEVAQLLEATLGADAAAAGAGGGAGAYAADTWSGSALAETGEAGALAETGAAEAVAGSRTTTRAMKPTGDGGAPPGGDGAAGGPRKRSRVGLFVAIAALLVAGGGAAAVVATSGDGASGPVVVGDADAAVAEAADVHVPGADGATVAIVTTKPPETVAANADEGDDASAGPEDGPDAVAGDDDGVAAAEGADGSEPSRDDAMLAVADDDVEVELAAGADDAAVAPAVVVPAAERVALDEALARFGEPPAPEACQLTDAAVMSAVSEALTKLEDGQVGSARDVDAEALAQLDSVVDGGRGAAEYWVAVARARMYGGKSPATSLEAATRAMTLCDAWGAGHNAAGNAQLRLGEATLAAAAYRAAVERSPSYIAPRFNLGLLALRRNDAREAVDVLSEVIGRAPEHPNARLLRGQAYLSLGDHARAEADLAAEADRDSRNARAWLLLGQARTGLGQQAAATVAFCKAKELGAPEADPFCP